MTSKHMNVLVTGGNRGIGLEFVKQLASNVNIKRVFATSRDPNYSEIVELQKQHEKGKIEIVELDLSKESSVNSAVKQVDSILGSEGLDILINNAAISEEPNSILNVSGDTLSKVFDNNVVNTHLITKALIPAIKRSETKKVIGISSYLGSITAADPKTVKDLTPMPSYCISKAALNMLYRQYSITLRDDKFIFLLISPGYVKTRMAPHGVMTTKESVESQLKVIFSSKIFDNGCFFRYNGENIPF